MQGVSAGLSLIFTHYKLGYRRVFFGCDLRTTKTGHRTWKVPSTQDMTKHAGKKIRYDLVIANYDLVEELEMQNIECLIWLYLSVHKFHFSLIVITESGKLWGWLSHTNCICIHIFLVVSWNGFHMGVTFLIL